MISESAISLEVQRESSNRFQERSIPAKNLATQKTVRIRGHCLEKTNQTIKNASEMPSADLDT